MPAVGKGSSLDAQVPKTTVSLATHRVEGLAPDRRGARLQRSLADRSIVDAADARRTQKDAFMRPWLLRFFSAPQAPMPVPARGARAAPAPPVRRAVQPAPAVAARPTKLELLAGQAGVDIAFFAWMVGRPADPLAPPGLRERRALRQLDRLVADTAAHGSLLPRGAAVVPQLLARLRSEASSAPELSQHVSRDITLVAEVIRMANSPYYRREAEVVEVEQAIRVLGVDGLMNAVARALLKPLIDARGGELAASGAKRLWEHTDHKAQLCAALAHSKGLAPFEGYLLGLVHDAVWSIVLRTMDRVEADRPWRLSAAFVAGLALRRDRLFGVVARTWQLTDNLTRVASEVAQRGLAGSSSAPVLLLFAGDRLASLICDPDKERAAAMAETLLGTLGGPVRDCYRALTQPRRAGQD
jgi:HD-like signal output (HDOD) protein